MKKGIIKMTLDIAILSAILIFVLTGLLRAMIRISEIEKICHQNRKLIKGHCFDDEEGD